MLSATGMVVVLGTVARADTSAIVLHEFIPPDPQEDLALAATTYDGTFPALMDTPSGLVSAPDTRRPPSLTESAYGSAAAVDASEGMYRPDRDTRRPRVSHYTDPYMPSVAPYKRLRAFDKVLDDYSLGLTDPRLVPVSSGGSVGKAEEAFFGDITVALSPGIPIRIPCVGPGARILRRETVTPVAVDILRDGAENWFVRGQVRDRVRLLMQVTISRDAFGGEFRDGLRSNLPPAPALPPTVASSAAEVLQSLGLSRGASTKDSISGLVEHFRAFEPSDEPPRGRANIYLDLALSKKGVCRHRAYAFVVTSLGLGIPARMVVNEAHAWVEVHDGGGWRRIDLGGAADELDDESTSRGPVHRPPPDPFPWPSQADSGAQLAQRARQSRPASASDSIADATAAQGGAATGGVTSQSETTDGDPVAGPVVRPSLVIVSSESRVSRGAPLRLRGSAATSQEPCAHARIDVSLVERGSSRAYAVGALSTDAEGSFDGSVVIPVETPVGDYELSVSTPGTARCAPGRSPK